MIKTDLHTHSVASPDGGISLAQYRHALESGRLDCIAVTDHNRIDFAQKLQTELGAERIIVGEEISTPEGDVIGLFLNEVIPRQTSARAAAEAIKAQGGLVYVPHPFETVRSGVSEAVLQDIASLVDIIESANGRAYFQNFGPKAHAWARLHALPAFASSDAHRAGGLGRTYTTLHEIPTALNLLKLAETGRKTYARPRALDILAPKHNRIRKLMRRERNT